MLSSYGTAGQAGNVWEFEETDFDLINDSSTSARGIRGGKWRDSSIADMSSTSRSNAQPFDISSDIGFRVASVPEPSGMLGAAIFTIGLIVRRRKQ